MTSTATPSTVIIADATATPDLGYGTVVGQILEAEACTSRDGRTTWVELTLGIPVPGISTATRRSRDYQAERLVKLWNEMAEGFIPLMSRLAADTVAEITVRDVRPEVWIGRDSKAHGKVVFSASRIALYGLAEEDAH